ncbi:MAG: transaldolase family protein [Giesbergeria sp.]
MWASTGTKDPAAPDTLYVEALAAPDTINTLPEKTLFAFSDHGKVQPSLQGDGGDAHPSPNAARRASTSTHSLSNCSAKALSRFRSPGPSCWTTLPARPRPRLGRPPHERFHSAAHACPN